MNSLPYEIVFNIIFYLPYQDIIKVCLTNRYFYAIYWDDTFWALKANFDFGVKGEQFGQSKLKGKYRYLKLSAIRSARLLLTGRY